MGLVRESLAAGEHFTGTDIKGWIWGKSGSGVVGWVLKSSLTFVKSIGGENPAGEARKIGLPKDYVGGADMKAAKAKGEHFAYSTDCKVTEDAPIFLDIDMQHPAGEAPIAKAGSTIAVRYAKAHVACVFYQGEWRFVRAEKLDLTSLHERLKKLHGKK